MKQIWFRAESEKPNCSAIIHATMDDHGIILKDAIISIPKRYDGHENILKGLKRNGFVLTELLFDIEQQFENEEI